MQIFPEDVTKETQRSEIKKVNPPALCHTPATRPVEERTPPNIVQRILGTHP